MKQLIHILLTAAMLLLSITKLQAQLPTDNPLVIKSSMDTLQCEFEMGRLSIVYPTEGFALLHSPSLPHSNTKEGFPTLPMVNQIVVIPEGGEIAVEVSDLESETLSLKQLGCSLPLLPVAESASRNLPSLLPKVNPTIYDADSFYRLPLVTLTPLGTMRGQRLALLSIAPIEYNAAQGMIKVHRHLRINITFPGSNSDATLQSWQQGASPFFPNLTGKNLTPQLPIHYLIVSRPIFAETLKPFIEWKQQQGYVVEQLLIDTYSRDTIRQRLQERYHTPFTPTPTFILLVGNNDLLQSNSSRHQLPGMSSHPTDLYFAEFTGDELPDALIGRWPVADSSQLRAVIEKTIAYEKYQLADTSYLNRSLLIAGTENRDVAPITTNGQINYVKHQLLEANSHIDTLCYYNPTSINQRDSIMLQWQQGAGLVNYTGHSFSSGWFHPTINTTDIDSMPANGRYSMVINNCCLANQFQSNCFGSHLLYKEQGGAIGSIGATNETLWNEDYYWALGAKNPFTLIPTYDSLHLGMFDRWLHHHQEPHTEWIQTAAQMLIAGNMAVSQYGSPYAPFYWEVYHLLGDPSLMPYIGIPSTMEIEFSTPPTIGATTLDLHGEPGALAALMQDTLHIGSTLLDAQGNGTIHLQQPLSSDSLLLTVTAQNRQPIIRRMAVNERVEEWIVATESWLLSGDNTLTANQPQQLQVVIKNVGQHTAYNHYWILHSHHMQMAPSLMVIDSLLPQQSDTLSFSLTAWPQLTSGSITLSMNDSCEGAIITSQELYFNLIQPEIVLDSVLLLLNNEPAKILMGDTDYNIQLMWRNQGAVDADSVSMMVSLVNNSATFDDLETTYFDITAQGYHTQWLHFHTTDSLQALHCQLQLTYSGISHLFPFYYLAGFASETFENGNLTTFPWSNTHTNPWHLVDDTVHGGHYAIRSDSISSRQTSIIELPITVNAADSISFYVRTSSETQYDRVGFAIDGKSKGSWSGINNWQRVAIPIAAGSHILRWSYTKDDDHTLGSDCGWIDDIQLPLSLWSHEVGYPYWVGKINDSTLGIIPIETLAPIRLYPNPAHDWVTIDFDRSSISATITVYDAVGRKVDFFETKTGSPIQYSTQHLRLGMYFITVRYNNETYMLRLMKQ